MSEVAELPPGVLADDEVNDLFLRAAKGDHVAQAAMSANVLAMADAGLTPLWEGLLVAEMYARAATMSGDPARMLELVDILIRRLHAGKAGPIGDAGPNVSLSLQTEIITMLDLAADAGEESAARTLHHAIAAFSPEAAAAAREVRDAAVAAADQSDGEEG